LFPIKTFHGALAGQMNIKSNNKSQSNDKKER